MLELNASYAGLPQQQSINISQVCQGLATEANDWAKILFLGFMALFIIYWIYFILAQKYPILNKSVILLNFAKDCFVIFLLYKIWSIVYIIK